MMVSTKYLSKLIKLTFVKDKIFLSVEGAGQFNSFNIFRIAMLCSPKQVKQINQSVGS